MRIDLYPEAWVEMTDDTTIVSWPYGHVSVETLPDLIRNVALAVDDYVAEMVPRARLQIVKRDEYNRGYREGYRDRGQGSKEAANF